MSNHSPTTSPTDLSASTSGQHLEQPNLQNILRHGRKALNCLACRQHKLKCNREVPCSSCVQARREDYCRQNPAPPRRIPSGRASRRKPAAKDVGNTSWAANEPLPSPLSNNPTDFDSSVSLGPGADVGSGPGTGSSGHKSAFENVPNDQNAHFVNEPSIPVRVAQSKKVGDLRMLDAYDALQGRSTSVLYGLSNGPILMQINPVQESSGDQFPAPKFPHGGEQRLFWKRHLCSLLPTQNQCDLLTGYYIEHINWIFQSIHVPSFRKEYERFWNTDVDEIDLIWLSLLYTIISLSGLYIPTEVAKIVGIPSSRIRPLAHEWHSASRQALHAGGFESKPCFTQLQTFSITQLYWYATNNVELLNSAMAQAVRNAQAIGLDKDTTVSTSLEREMRHRIWWDLCDADTFQSICLSRPPLIQARISKVPIPLNCNDIDITETSIHPRPIDQPTEMSMHVFRAKVFKLFNKLYIDDGAHVSSYEFVKAIDAEILAVVDEFPWYFKLEENGSLPPALEIVSWQFHILHTCICTQRIRMYRFFLHPRIGDSWTKCVKAAEDAFIVYRNIRAAAGEEFTKSQKFLGQAYQVFSVAVAIAALLIVERSVSNEKLRNDIEMAITDLASLDSKETSVSLAVEGRKVLIQMLAIHDQRGASSPEEPEDLVSGIQTVFGGEQTARSYLKRLNIRQLLNPTQENSERYLDGRSTLPRPGTGMYNPQLGYLSNESLQQMQDGQFDFQQMDMDLSIEAFNWWPMDSFLPYMDFTA